MKIFLLFMSIITLCFGAIILPQQIANDAEQKNIIVVKSKPLTNMFLSRNVPLIDVRTPQEWEETGIIPQSHLITFYKEDDTYDEKEFLITLSTIVSKNDTFVILCRSGNRSLKVANFLAAQGYTHVINVSGGIKEALRNGVKTIPYSG